MPHNYKNNMKIIKDSLNFRIQEPTAAAIGKFDGFHLGHQKLLHHLEMNKRRGLKTVAFTFSPSPASYFSASPVQELSATEEKRAFFETAGVDYLVEYPFVQATADMPPEAFIKDVLVGMLNAECIVAGSDISYGKGGKGDAALLKQMSHQGGFNFDVEIISKVLHDNAEISSTRVRTALQSGDMELVSALLGRPYRISGKIVHGKKFGRTLVSPDLPHGIPTANIIPPAEKLLPPDGVYYTRALLPLSDHAPLPSITNIGANPTIPLIPKTVETYIYDFDEDIYGRRMDVCLLHRKRPETRFPTLRALQTQMTADIADGRNYHSKNIY